MEPRAEVDLERPFQVAALEAERQPVAIEVKPVTPVALGLIVLCRGVLLVGHLA